jgi:drug/metabolite transporter (DMT)-like permease
MASRKGGGNVATEAALVLAATFWGLNFAATKYAAGAVRFALAGAILYLVLRVLEPKSRLARRDLVPMAALGCFGVATAQTGFTFGLSLASAGSAGLIFATAPVWGMLLGAALGLERPTRSGVLGVGLSVVGVAAVVSDGLGGGGSGLLGELVILVAAVCVGAYAVLSMPLLERYSPLAVATYPVLFGAPLLLILSLPQLPGVEWGSMGPGPPLAVLYASVFATAFAFAAWQRGISRIGANRVLVYQYLITLVGVSSGVVFFGESLGPTKIFGGLVILLGVYLARRSH